MGHVCQVVAVCPTRGVLAGRYRVKRRRLLRPVRFRLRAARTPHRGHAVRGHRAGGDGNSVYSLDALTGSKPGEVRMPNEVSQLGVSGSTVYVGDERNTLHAVHCGDTWQFAAQDRIRSRPAIADGTVFFSSLGKSVYAVDAATGDKKWSLADSLNGIVHAVDAASGGRRWSVRTGLP
ncbi:PQQ-binding-like beta-propeller repeat protein [Streptomyces sp. NPDC001262]|uniref:outer membrane protein assembly factor BamB family protein n=1 Tax=Streptomyces sp. NPDC001262 TaxID=3364552 RepID=UPI0036C09DA2